MFNLLIIFNKRLLPLILPSLIHAGKRQLFFFKSFAKNIIGPSWFLPFQGFCHLSLVFQRLQSTKPPWLLVFKEWDKDLNFLIAKNTNYSSSWKLLLLLNVLSKTVCHARSRVWTTWRVSLSKLLVFQGKLENILVKSFHRTNTTTLRTSFQAKTLHHFSIVLRKFIFELCFKI